MTNLTTGLVDSLHENPGGVNKDVAPEPPTKDPASSSTNIKSDDQRLNLLQTAIMHQPQEHLKTWRDQTL